LKSYQGYIEKRWTRIKKVHSQYWIKE